MRAGSLDRVVTLLRRGPAVDDGLTTKPGGYAPIGARRASVKPEMRPERLEAMGVSGKRVISVWLRSDSLTRALTAASGLLYAGETYELAAPPLEIGRREGVELFAVASDFDVEED